MNEPKDIGEIVREAYVHSGLADPLRIRRRAEDVVTDLREDVHFSWLGKWSDCGWSIRIEPKLTDTQWAQYWPRADEGWDGAVHAYSPTKNLELLHSLFPTHQLRLVWPKCTYRTRHTRKGSQTPLYVACGAIARHTGVTRDVYEQGIAVPRCNEHQGQL